MARDIQNYWTDRLTFKERIIKRLTPKLKVHSGKILSEKLSLIITKQLLDFIMEETGDLGWNFSCAAAIECERAEGTTTDMIKGINVFIVD